MAEITSITQRPAWQALATHYRQIKDVHLRTLFAHDPDAASVSRLRQWACTWTIPSIASPTRRCACC